MNKGDVSDIKPGMLVKLAVSAGPDLGLVYHADADIFSVLILNNSGENGPTRIDAEDIICAWNLSQLSTYVIGDLLQGRASGWTSALDKAVVYRSIRPEAVEMTLEEISELVSKQLGKPVSVSVKDAEPEGVEPGTEVVVVPEDGAIARDAQIGEEFEIKGVRYRVIEDTRASNGHCDGCALKTDRRCCYYTGLCGSDRKDGKSILFERVPAEDEHPDYSESDRIEVAVGECMELDGITYRCVKDSSQRVAYCNGCALGDRICADFECSAERRKDGISVHFIKVSDTPEDGKNVVLQQVEEKH